MKVNKEKCTGCESCKDVCPIEAIKMVDGKAEINKDECVECQACFVECPREAITLE